MDKPQAKQRSHLFVLRIRLQDRGEGETEWWGDIQDIVSRERRYFREWSVLLDFVQASLQAERADDFSTRRDKNT